VDRARGRRGSPYGAPLRCPGSENPLDDFIFILGSKLLLEDAGAGLV
jgi:hypothetical protein